MLFVSVMDLWVSSIGIIGLAFNLRAYDFVMVFLPLYLLGDRKILNPTNHQLDHLQKHQ